MVSISDQEKKTLPLVGYELFPWPEKGGFSHFLVEASEETLVNRDEQEKEEFWPKYRGHVEHRVKGIITIWAIIEPGLTASSSRTGMHN